jgi:GNAT superfamily N-acetyltransferase
LVRTVTERHKSMSQNLLSDYRIRTFEEGDRASVGGLGSPVIGWWHDRVDGASLHIVAESMETGEVVGHLQARDRSTPKPSRREGQCHFTLDVAPGHRRRGVGGCLYDRVEAFARARKALLLYCGYKETLESPAASFLRERGFAILERFLPSYRDLDTFSPKNFHLEMQRVAQQGIVLTTYSSLEDTPGNRRQLHSLEENARATQPYREVSDYIATPFPEWESEFLKRDQTGIFLALAPDTNEYLGVVTALEWGFTGTHPNWRGCGIATALKVFSLQEAAARGFVRIETENHEDNAAMLAVNRKLGFIFTDAEVGCVKRLE